MPRFRSLPTHLVRERGDDGAHGDEDDPDGRRDHGEGVQVQVVVDGVADARDQEAQRVPRPVPGRLGEGPCARQTGFFKQSVFQTVNNLIFDIVMSRVVHRPYKQSNYTKGIPY